MRNVIPYLIFCFFPLFFYSSANSQDTTANRSSDNTYFETGLTYLNNNVYLARGDSAKVPYLTAAFNYYNKSGFFVGTSFSYLANSSSTGIDLITIEGGYTLTEKKLSAQLSAEKDFYNRNSKNVRSETLGSLNGSVQYDLGLVVPVIQAGIVFSSKDDYYASFGLDRSFFFLDDNLEFAPEVIANASTQNFYSSYYLKRKFKSKKKNQAGGVVTKTYVTNAPDFRLLDYEFAMPVDYALGKFIFDLTPKVAFPVNPNLLSVTVTQPNGTSVTHTKVENVNTQFYWSASVSYEF